jgi:hypothetical protein
MNDGMLHIIEIKVERLCVYSPEYKFIVERITLNKNNKFLNHHYLVLMHLSTVYHTCVPHIYIYIRG